MTQADVGERRITFADLARFRRSGLIEAHKFGAAAFAVRDHRQSAGTTNGALLALGAIYLAVGIVFYGAHIWDDLPDWQKFTIIEAGIAVLAVGALFAGLTKPAGQALLIAATLTTGLLLHAVEWIYPTAAGRLGIYLAWTLIILPWVTASRSPAHWIVWTAIALQAVHAFVTDYPAPADLLPAATLPFVLAGLPALVLAVGEILRRRGGLWLRPIWPRYLLLALVLALLLAVELGHRFPDQSIFGGGGAGLESTIIFTCALAASVCYYSFGIRDYAAFVITVAFAALAVIVTGAWMIDQRIGLSTDGPPNLTGWLAMFVLVAICISATAVLLRLQWRAFGPVSHAD